jgi:hypothetical protein
MRLFSLAFLTAAIAGCAWLTVHSAEQEADAKGPAQAKQETRTKSVEKTDEKQPDDAVKEIISGKVVMLVDALKLRGVKTYAEEIQGQVVLVTAEKELIPIVPDWRGRAFYQDERLRDRQVDLVVNRRPGVPWMQVLSIYTFDEKGTRNITDYWCDVCSIPMYEIKDCECCQGPTRLRFRPQELPQLKKQNDK